MKYTPIYIVIACMLASGAEESKKPEPTPKYLTAADALSFAEAAAMSIQGENEINKAQVELERARLKVEMVKANAKITHDAYVLVMRELRAKGSLAENCNPEATGKAEPDKKYQWACSSPPAKK